MPQNDTDRNRLSFIRPSPRNVTPGSLQTRFNQIQFGRNQADAMKTAAKQVGKVVTNSTRAIYGASGRQVGADYDVSAPPRPSGIRESDRNIIPGSLQAKFDRMKTNAKPVNLSNITEGLRDPNSPDTVSEPGGGKNDAGARRYVSRNVGGSVFSMRVGAPSPSPEVIAATPPAQPVPGEHFTSDFADGMLRPTSPAESRMGLTEPPTPLLPPIDRNDISAVSSAAYEFGMLGFGDDDLMYEAGGITRAEDTGARLFDRRYGIMANYKTARDRIEAMLRRKPVAGKTGALVRAADLPPSMDMGPSATKSDREAVYYVPGYREDALVTGDRNTSDIPPQPPTVAGARGVARAATSAERTQLIARNLALDLAEKDSIRFLRMFERGDAAKAATVYVSHPATGGSVSGISVRARHHQKMREIEKRVKEATAKYTIPRRVKKNIGDKVDIKSVPAGPTGERLVSVEGGVRYAVPDTSALPIPVQDKVEKPGHMLLRGEDGYYNVMVGEETPEENAKYQQAFDLMFD